MYYEINENAARTAKELNSFSDYKEGSTTADYRYYVDIAAEAAEEQKRKHPGESERIDALLDRYSRLLADWYNENSRIEAMCPSIMIAGPANFPVRKKEKQNIRRRAHMEKWNYIQGIVDQIRGTGEGGIKSNDALAVEKLMERLDILEAKQSFMKAVNAWYRREKTLDGCPLLNAEQIEQLKAEMSRDWRGANAKPFESYTLTNNNAEIKRTRERLEKLKTVKESGTKETESAEIEGLKIVENTEAMRIQLIFDGKPDEQIRNILKHRGFRWSPRFGAWQRDLNDHGKYAAKQAIEEIKKL